MAELAGLRALVVEDEGSVAWLIEGMLEELGCEVAASVVTLAEALAAATDNSFDFAVLDVNLAGELVFPVAELLQRRQLPFLFSTGYGRMGVPATFRGYEVLNKPFGIDELKRKLCITLGKRR
jgi:CheY-like chemotaxis protein